MASKKKSAARPLSSFDDLDAAGIGIGYRPMSLQEPAQVETVEKDAASSRGALRAVADVGLEAASGAAKGIKFMSDVFGASNPVSQGLQGVSDFAKELQSAQAKGEDQRIAQLMKEAEDKGVGEQVKAALRAAGEAPVRQAIGAIGTSVPMIAASMVPGLREASWGTRAAALGGMGGAQGVGVVKSQMYDSVYQRALEEGRSEQEARALADQAQAYSAENAGDIALGGALGAGAALTGFEPAAARAIGQTAAKGVQRGLMQSTLRGVAAEALPEAIQGGQEQVAGNRAEQRAGFDTPTFRGAAGSATLEGLLSAPGGAVGGMLDARGAKPAPKLLADQIRATESVPESGPMTRAANQAVEARAQQVELSAAAEGAALAGMEAQSQADLQGLRDFAGVTPNVVASMPMADQPPVAAPSAQPSAEFIDSPFTDRILTVQEMLADPATREKVRERWGDEGLGNIAYYLGVANRGGMPEKTQENLLGMAERLLQEAVLRPIQPAPELGGQRPDPLLLGSQPQPEAPALGMDTTPSGRFTVDSQGNAVPESRAQRGDAQRRADEIDSLGRQTPRGQAQPAATMQGALGISMDTTPSGRFTVDSQGNAVPESRAQRGDAQRRADEIDSLGRQTPRGQAQPAATMQGALGISMDTAPTGRLLVGQEGVRPETRMDAINIGQADMQRQAEAAQRAELGLTPDIEAVQQRNAMRPLDGDILNPSGKPFKTLMAAQRAAKKNPGQVVEVTGGFAIRPATMVAAQPEVANDGRGNQDAAGLAEALAVGNSEAGDRAATEPAAVAQGEMLDAIPGQPAGDQPAQGDAGQGQRVGREGYDTPIELDAAQLKTIVARRKQAKAESDAAYEAKRQAEEDERITERAGREMIQFRDTNETLPIKDYIDGLIAKGFNTIRASKTGAITKTYLANEQGNGYPLPSGIVRDYAQTAARRAAQQPAPTAAPVDEAQPTQSAASSTITADDVAGAEKQAAQMISDRIDGMKAADVQRIAARYLPTVGIRVPMGKARIKAAMTDAAAMNLLGPAGELGIELSDSVKRALTAKMEGRVGEAAAPVAAAAPAPAQPEQQTADQQDDGDGWSSGFYGVAGTQKKYTFNGKPDGHWASVKNPVGQGYEIEYRLGDKVVSAEEVTGSLTAVKSQVSKRVVELDATQATHKDPGQPAETVTQPVIQAAMKKAARNEDTKPSEMRTWLLGEIDKALQQAPDLADYDATVKRVGEKDAVSMFTGGGLLGKNSKTGYVTFDVPGDGTFKVRNSVRGLLEFKRKVAASPGFKDRGQDRVRPEEADSVRRGSGGLMSAITNMIEEGDFEAARDYAEAVGVNLEDVKAPKGTETRWKAFVKDGTLPAEAPAAQFPVSIDVESFEREFPEFKGYGITQITLKQNDIDFKSRDTIDNYVTINKYTQRDFINAYTAGKLSKAADRQADATKAEVAPASAASTYPYTSQQIASAYAQAESAIRGKAWSANADSTHKGRIRLRLKDMGMSEQDAQALLDRAATIQAGEMAGMRGAMMFLRLKDLQRAAIYRGLVEEPAADPAPQPATQEQAAEAPADVPKLTQAEAAQLMEWQDMGQKNGVKTHALRFYASQADKDAKRGIMTLITVSKGDVSDKAWTVDGDDQKFGMLAQAKKRGMELGMARAVKDGFVEPTKGRAIVSTANDKPVETLETEKGVALFASSSAPAAAGRGIPLQLAKDVTDKVLDGLGLRGLIAPNVFRNTTEAGISDPASIMPTGGTSAGKIYVFSDNVVDAAEVFKVVFHELFHLGLSQSKLPNGYVQTMLAFLKDPVVRQLANDWKASKDGRSRLGKMPLNNWHALAVEEALAIIGEELNTDKNGIGGKAMTGWVKRTIVWMAGLADKWGLSSVARRLRAMTYTEAEAFVQETMLKGRTGAPVYLPDTRFAQDQGGQNVTFRGAAKDYIAPAMDKLNETFSHPGKLSWWHKTVGSMYNLAERMPAFKPVYDAAQSFINDVSFYAIEAADKAPRLLPRIEEWKDLAKSPITAQDNKAVAAPVFEGTLSWRRDELGKPVLVEDLAKRYASLTPEQKAQRLLRAGAIGENVLKMWRGMPQAQYESSVNTAFEGRMLKAGIVFTPDELKSIFKLNDAQVALYQEFRQSIDASLDNMGKSDLLRVAGKDATDLKDAVMTAPDVDAAAVLLRDHLLDLAKEDPGRRDELTTTANDMITRAEKVQRLKMEGYAPLSRFGQYTVDVVVDGERQYFSMFETARDANRMAAKLKMEYGAENVAQGTLSQREFEMLQGITPETLELFGNMLGLDSTGNQAQDQVFQEYLKRTKANRSAMKRLIHRKGIAGYSEDVGRVLAAFVYSNARQTSAALHMGDLGEAVMAIPKGEGELKDAAVELARYVKEPREEAAKMRGWLFAQYLGGSIASAIVNFTQPLTTSAPYLSQFGGMGKSVKALYQAMADLKDQKFEAGLAESFRKRTEDGTLAPQGVHELMAQSRGQATLRTGDGTQVGDALAKGRNALSKVMIGWGKLFGIAEQINRQSTYVAAYRTAVERGIADPDAFAKKAVDETQFVNNKANKMRFGRGAIGATLMTFKSYSLNWLELFHRLAAQNGREGKMAAAWMVGVLLLSAGASGLPFAEDAEDLADFLAQRLGYNWSSKRARQEFLESLFGRDIGGFVENGLTGLPGAPIDVSGRLGMGNMVPGTGLLLSKKDHTSDFTEVLGPAGDLAKRTFQAGDLLLSGNVKQAALMIAPRAIGNLEKGVDMATTSMYRDVRGYKVDDATTGEAIGKAVGFQPRAVAQIQEASGLNQRAKDFYRLKVERINAKWAKAIFEKDAETVDQVRAEIKEWNRQNPDQRIQANIPAILRRVKEMRKTKAERIADTAPKALRASMREEVRKMQEEMR